MRGTVATGDSRVRPAVCRNPSAGFDRTRFPALGVRGRSLLEAIQRDKDPHAANERQTLGYGEQPPAYKASHGGWGNLANVVQRCDSNVIN